MLGELFVCFYLLFVFETRGFGDKSRRLRVALGIYLKANGIIVNHSLMTHSAL